MASGLFFPGFTRIAQAVIFHLLLTSFIAGAQPAAKPEEGDFLFLDLDCGGLCEAIEAVTEGAGGRDFSHLGLVHQRGDSVFVLEAMGNSVRLTPLSTFLSYTKKPALLARLKPEFRKLIPQAMAFGLTRLGFPYDDAFLPDNGKYYCSELVYDCFLQASGRHDFFSLRPMTFRQPGKQEFFPVWISYYQKLGIPVPEGIPGCNPGGISSSEKLEILGNFTLTQKEN